MRRRTCVAALLLVGCSEAPPLPDAHSRDATASVDADLANVNETDATQQADALPVPSDAGSDAGVATAATHANAIEDLGVLRALYGAGSSAVFFRLTPGASIEALSRDGTSLWSHATDADRYTGGFDLDRDGTVDLALIHASPAASCNAYVVYERYLQFFSGRTGANLGRSLPARDRCWVFPGVEPYTTTQWSELGVLFGEGTHFISLQTQYEQQGFFASYESTLRALSPQYAYVYPSTSQFAEYRAARPNAYGGTPWVENAHVANGLVMQRGGEEHVALFTSARLAVYRAAPYGPMQLVSDHPFVARADIAGRNYGLVSLDPERPERLSLLAGADVSTVHHDRIAGRRESNPWAGIERHVTVFNMDTGVLTQRFFSYAHDGGDAQQYEGRIIYPAQAHLRTAVGAPSRLAFNVFAAGHWHLHITEPASANDAVVLDDVFLWDVRDIDGDGRDECILSPTVTSGDAYLPQWRTRTAHWDEASRSLTRLDEADGIPELVQRFRSGTATTSETVMSPVAIVFDASGGATLALHQASGAVTRWR